MSVLNSNKKALESSSMRHCDHGGCDVHKAVSNPFRVDELSTYLITSIVVLSHIRSTIAPLPTVHPSYEPSLP